MPGSSGFVDAHLDGGTAQHGRNVWKEALARALADHPFDEVDPGHLFGDAVLDLKARVDFEEVRLLGARIDDELHRPRRRVLHRAPHFYRVLREDDALVFADSPGAWCFLDDLLVAPLERAVALAQRQHVPRAVAEDLHFDVPGLARGTSPGRPPSR